MLPSFGNERRRPINLGGATSAASHADILEEAKNRRAERQNNKRRQENAVRLQAWWRGAVAARGARQQMRRTFETDIAGISGLRCLVLIGKDEEVLARWSNVMISAGQGALFNLARGPHRRSWTVLIKQAAVLLLWSITSARSLAIPLHLKILNQLLSSATVVRALGQCGLDVCKEITEYVIRRDFYPSLVRPISALSVDAKSPLAPLIVTLALCPLTTSLQPSTHLKCLEGFFTHILGVSLLPNRLPFPSLTELSSKLPYSSLDLILPSISRLLHVMSVESRAHLIANLTTFTTPRLPKLQSKSLDAYLQLITTLLNSMPPGAFGQSESGTAKSSWMDDDSDSEHVVVSAAPSQAQALFSSLDLRTRKRLQTLPSPSHVHALLLAGQRCLPSQANVVSFLSSITSMWPAQKNKILSAVVVHTSGSLVYELYETHVRDLSVGADDTPTSLIDAVPPNSWLAILFLADLYTHTLLTMGDDEFFSTTTGTTKVWNPLNIYDLVVFSRKLLNLAFALYWRDDQLSVQKGGVPGLSVKWESARETITKCLLAIHARDSRRPFTPPGHWLVTSQIDMQSFIEAAIYEEQQLYTPAGKRALSKRQIAYLSPRLGVLHNIPFAIPFDVRVSIFRHFVASDRASRLGGDLRTGYRRGNRVRIRRGSVAQDGFDKLGEADLKNPIEITFIDQFDQEEAGIDGGGVFKEFFTSLCKEVFDTDRGLWLATSKNELYPNPHSYATEPHSLEWYRFIGRILGKALYDGILVDVAFAGFFLAKWLGRQSFLDDLASLDLDLYNGLLFLKHYEGNVEDLSLNFTVAVEEFGTPKSLDLIPNGSNIPVTRENRLQYIHLISHYRLSKQIKLQSEAFFEGLSEMIDPKWLRMFNQQEAQILIGGVNAPVDLDDLRKNTLYSGVYDDNEDTITSFWNVVNSFDQEQRRGLLRFVTSCSRPPLLGFKELMPNFAIRDAGTDEHRLPTSSTCVNLLKLPRYKSEEVLRQKLLKAITAGAGFDLS